MPSPAGRSLHGWESCQRRRARRERASRCGPHAAEPSSTARASRAHREPGSHQLLPSPRDGRGAEPQIAFANERINDAFAQLRAAKVLWLPSIRAGLSYHHHEGPLQDNVGAIVVGSRSALEAGLGTTAVGAGSPAIAGVSADFRLSDAVFQPRIAGQQVAARNHAATATSHDFLLLAAVAHLDLLRAFQQQAIAEEALQHTEQLAKLTTEFARTGQGNQADADRAQTELAVRKNGVAQAAVQAQLASARLVELLSLPPDRELAPEEPALVPIELVSHESKAADLVSDGLSRRPELASSQHLVAEAIERLNRERYAPQIGRASCRERV